MPPPTLLFVVRFDGLLLVLSLKNCWKRGVVSRLVCTVLVMKVYRGTLVHCLEPQATDVLSDHVIGFQEDESGKVYL